MRGLRIGWGLLLSGLLLMGCTTTPRPPLYTPEELAAQCVRGNGTWRPNLLGGFCDHS